MWFRSVCDRPPSQDVAQAYTCLIPSGSLRRLRAIYRPGFRYAKAGVMLLGLQDTAVEQRELDLDDACENRSRLMGQWMRSTIATARVR